MSMEIDIKVIDDLILYTEEKLQKIISSDNYSQDLVSVIRDQVHFLRKERERIVMADFLKK